MLQSTDLPLSRFAVFKTHDVDQAREEVGKIFCPHRLETRSGTSLHARHHNVDLGGFSLNYVQYGADVLIEPGELGTFFLLQIPLTGSARVRCGTQTAEATDRQASLLSPNLGVSMRWSQSCTKLLVQIPRVAMERTLQSMLGRTLRGAIEFDASVDLGEGAGQRIARLVHLLRDDVDSADPMFLRSGAGPRLGETLMTGLLTSVRHNFAAALAAPAPGIAPRHVRAAEEYMRAKVASHLTVAEIAAKVGVSTRSLQEGFRRFRDTTPLEALHALRLAGARAALLGGEGGESVTSVALAWGFPHLSRFASAYAERYQELPSATLRRRRDR